MNRSTLVERGSPLGCFPGQPTPRLYDRVVEVLRARNHSRRTEEAYVHWIRGFPLFHAGAQPRELGEGRVNTFLTHRAITENVTASTQDQALAALLFLYGHVLEQAPNRIQGVIRVRKLKRPLVVVTSDDVEALLAHLDGVPSLVCTLIYGSALRLLEGLQMRVKGLDFGRGGITVREGKGHKDRVTMLPGVLRPPAPGPPAVGSRTARSQLEKGLGRAPLPNALIRKYPNADHQWAWQWVFPASSHYLDRRTGLRHRHHLHESVIQKAVRDAVRRADVAKPATSHAFRHY